MKKYFNNFHLSLKEKHNIIKTYKNGDVSCFFSPTIAKVEKLFADYVDMPYVIATTNCTSALYLAYKSLQITDKNSNIIIPNFTHPSTAFALKMANIKMKLCDCKQNSYNLNTKMLERLIDQNTKAVVFVHMRGYIQNILDVQKICKKHNIVLIEDVAQGLGIEINGKKAGSFGEISCFSFNDSKTIQLGEGGMCCFRNKSQEEYARKIIHEGEYSIDTQKSTTICNGSAYSVIFNKFDYIPDGFNFRPFPPIFSILENRLKNINKLRIKKNKIRDIYKNNIDKNLFKSFDTCENDLPICFPMLTDNVDVVKNVLLNFYHSGYPIGKMAYPTLNKIKSFENCCLNFDDNFENSENLYDRLLFLPLSQNITKKMATKLTRFLNNSIKKSTKVLPDGEIDNFDGFYLW